MKDLIDAMRNYFNKELDQWDMLKMNTKFGPIYITFSMMPLYGKDADYELIGEEKEG